jgi:hypothetical protein
MSFEMTFNSGFDAYCSYHFDLRRQQSDQRNLDVTTNRRFATVWIKNELPLLPTTYEFRRFNSFTSGGHVCEIMEMNYTNVLERDGISRRSNVDCSI